MNDSKRQDILLEKIKNQDFQSIDEFYNTKNELQKYIDHAKDIQYQLEMNMYSTYYLIDVARIDEAIEIASHSIDIARSIHNKHYLIRFYNVYALILRTTHNDLQAMDYYVKALDYAIREKDYEYQAKLRNNIGDSFLHCNDYRRAREYFLDAYYACMNVENEKIRNYIKMYTADNLALSSLELQLYDDTLKYAQECLELAHSMDNLPIEFSALNFKSSALFNLGNKQEAQAIFEDLYHKYLSNIATLDTPQNIADSYFRIIHLAMDLDECEAANQLIKKAENHIYKTNLDASKVILTSYKIDFEKKYDYYHNLSDLLYEYYIQSQQQTKTWSQNRSDSLIEKIQAFELNRKQKQVEKQNKLLRDLSERDELTGLLNRRSLNGLLQNYQSLSNLDSQIGIMIFDIDHFKEFNDIHGHLSGDEILCQVANALTTNETDFFVTRFGGDEFITVCMNAKYEKMVEYAKKVYEKVSALDSSKYGKITLSCGYSICPCSNFDKIKLTHEADVALYHAKNNGRNQYCFFNEVK